MDEEFQTSVQEMLAERQKEFKNWWDNLPDDRKNKYQELRVLGTDSDNNSLKFHLYKCWPLLDIIDNLVDPNQKKVIPKALSIHGTCPVVLVQVEGQETPRGRNMNEIWQTEVPVKSVMTKIVKATFDTTPFGIKSEQIEILPDIKSRDWTLQIPDQKS